MINRTITDFTTGLAMVSSIWWMEYVQQGLEFMAVLGGIVIMVMRGWLMWKEIQDRRDKDGNS